MVSQGIIKDHEEPDEDETPIDYPGTIVEPGPPENVGVKEEEATADYPIEYDAEKDEALQKSKKSANEGIKILARV